MASICENQIENRNFLLPTQFIFTLNRAPKVSFFANSANIPSMTLGIAVQPTYLENIAQPGDKISFEDLSRHHQYSLSSVGNQSSLLYYCYSLALSRGEISIIIIV